MPWQNPTFIRIRTCVFNDIILSLRFRFCCRIFANFFTAFLNLCFWRLWHFKNVKPFYLRWGSFQDFTFSVVSFWVYIFFRGTTTNCKREKQEKSKNFNLIIMGFMISQTLINFFGWCTLCCFGDTHFVRIGLCSNWIVLELNCVRIELCSNWIVFELNCVRIELC